MLLYTVAIVLVHAVLAVQCRNPFHKSLPADDIESLCEGKSVDLVTVPELDHLNSIVGDSKCPPIVKAAIPDLKTLIRQTKDDLCAEESINKLREFYAKYLDTSTKENKQREELPESLKKFALAYGMQMSSTCKTRMVDVLTKEVQDKLYTEAQTAIRALVSEKSPVADMLEGLAGADEILLPGDLAPYIKDKQPGEDDTIYLQTSTAPYIRRMQDNCNLNFAPLYRPLIRPIVQLVNMGFNYKDEPLRCNMGCSVTSRQLAKWSRLVFLCESLNNIRVVDVENKSANPEDPQLKTVRILTKEEAAALEKKEETEPEEIREYRFRKLSLKSEVIFNKEDKKLKKAIKAFSTSKSEEEKVAKRMVSKGKTLFKIQLKRGNIGVLLSTGSKALVHRIRTGENLKPSDEIVKLLDGAIGHESEILDHGDLQSNWEATKEIARDIGSFLAGAVLGILFIAFWLGVIALIVMKIIIVAHMAG